jgi:hypothetical protein
VIMHVPSHANPTLTQVSLLESGMLGTFRAQTRGRAYTHGPTWLLGSAPGGGDAAVAQTVPATLRLMVVVIRAQ